MQNIQQLMQKNLQSKFSGTHVETPTSISTKRNLGNQTQATSSSSATPEVHDKRIDTLFVCVRPNTPTNHIQSDTTY